MASFLLIQVDPGYVASVAHLLANTPGVYDVSVTSGPYDVIAEVTPEPERQRQVRSTVRRAPGLMRLVVSQCSVRRPAMS